MSVSDCGVKNKKYKLEAPEGGWGYLIAIAVVIIFFSTTAIVGVFGLLFNDFLEEIKMSSTSLTLLTGIMALCYAISGFLTGSMLKIMSRRKLALLAAIIFDIGLIGNVFTYSASVFFVCQAIMHGIGIGILYNIACTMLNDYFVKRRLIMTSIIQTTIALITMCVPIVVEWSLDKYGYRGTLLLVAGVMMNNLVAVALLQPVKWHMKKVDITGDTENEIQLLLQTEKKSNEQISEVPVTITDVERQTKLINEKTLAMPSKTKQKNKAVMFFKLYLDLTLSKEDILSFALLGPGLCIFADTTFNIILPQALYVNGWEKDHVAFALSLTGFGDLAGRIFMVCASKWISKLGSHSFYLIGISISVCSRLGFLWSRSLTPILVFITITGCTRCCVATLIPLVVADAVSPEKFTSAMGISMLMGGAMNLILGPLVGAVRDLTKSYDVAFYILTSIMGAVILFWSIEICYKQNKNKRKARKEYLQRSVKTQNT